MFTDEYNTAAVNTLNLRLNSSYKEHIRSYIE